MPCHRVHQAVAEAAQPLRPIEHQNKRNDDAPTDDAASHSRRALAAGRAVFPVPIFLGAADVLHDQSGHSAFPAEHFLRRDAGQLHFTHLRRVEHHIGYADHRLREQPAQQPAAQHCISYLVALARRAGSLRVRALQVPARRGHGLHLAVAPFRSSHLVLLPLQLAQDIGQTPTSV
jgi:hypothetical protein